MQEIEEKERRYAVAIVAACPLPWPRGTPLRIARTAEALAIRGNDVHVVTYHLGAGELADPVHVHRMALPTYRRTTPGPSLQKLLAADPLLARKLYAVVRSVPIDIIHAHHYEGLLIGSAVARFTGHPVVYDAHTLLQDELAHYHLGLPARLKVGLGRYIDRSLPRLADHSTAVTKRIRQHLIDEAGLSPSAVTTVGNGVDLLDSATGLASEADRRDTRSGDAGRTLVFAGNLASYQGIALLLEAFARVARRRSDVRLSIVTGDSFSSYEPLAARLGVLDRVDVVDAELPELFQLLASADIAANPRPVAPGVPVKVLNYMVSGLPVVSFEGSTGGLLTHEDTGWLVREADIDAFADAVIELLDRPDEARRLGEAARRHVLGLGSWGDKAREIEQVYGRVLAMCTGREAGHPGDAVDAMTG